MANAALHVYKLYNIKCLSVSNQDKILKPMIKWRNNIVWNLISFYLQQMVLNDITDDSAVTRGRLGTSMLNNEDMQVKSQ